jgi:hypothetical protein
MSYLDLLPENQRGGYARRLHLRTVLFGVLMSATLAFGGLVVLSFDASLNEIFDTTLINMSSSPAYRAAGVILASNTASVAPNFYHGIGSTLADVATVAPSNIRFKGTTFDATSGLFEIKGLATSVPDAENFRQRLEAGGRLKSVTLATQSLQPDGSVSFTIDAAIVMMPL